MWIPYVCEAPYPRQIQICTARDLQKNRNRTKSESSAKADVTTQPATTQPVTVPGWGLALAVLLTKICFRWN